jgi:outer membrane protein assembly factor BamB/tetratricopeptide (TPR) repeat protein
MAGGVTRALQRTEVEARQQGTFTRAFYRQILDGIHEKGLVCTLTVSTGVDERVFFFTRGAILFGAIGASGGEVMARKLRALGLVPAEKIDGLVARANAGVPLLQELLITDSLLKPERVQALVEEVTEDNLLEVALWEGALYDYNPGNPPTRLYAHDMPAVRLSIGAKPLVARVLSRLEAVDAALNVIGGSLSGLVIGTPRGADDATLEQGEKLVLKNVGEARSAGDVIIRSVNAGLPPLQAAEGLASLSQKGRVSIKTDHALTKDEELSRAAAIEKELGRFVNRFIGRTHLAGIYERIGDERAVEQFRAIGEEHLSEGRIPEALEAYGEVVRLAPADVPAREVRLKIYREQNKLQEAQSEAVELARVYLGFGLPGRARQAFMLASRLIPKSKAVLWMLAGLQRRLGEREGATKRYEELAEAHGPDEAAGKLSAWQQILDINAKHQRARAGVRHLSGYGRAIAIRLAVSGAIVVFFAAVFSWGFYELSARRAYFAMRARTGEEIEARRFAEARERVTRFKTDWRLAIVSGWSRELLDEVGTEERLDADVQAHDTLRSADELLAARNFPAALVALKAARGVSDTKLAARVEARVEECQAELNRVEEDLSRARRSAGYEGNARRAHDEFVSLVERAPWLVTETNFRIPFLVETRPEGGFVAADGGERKGPAPVVVERPAAAGVVQADLPEYEPAVVRIGADAPWPFVVPLKRKSIWRAQSHPSNAPALAGPAVVTAGLDRVVTAFRTTDGSPLWRLPLDVFDECDLPLVALDPETVLVRTSDGSAIAVDGATGKVKWRQDMLPPEGPGAGRPVLVKGGVVLRAGPRSLIFIDLAGRPRRVEVPVEPVGPPAAGLDLVVLASKRSVVAFRLADFGYAWEAQLPETPATDPVVGPGGLIYIGLSSGVVARVDASGRVSSSGDSLGSLSRATPIAGDEKNVVLGTSSGEVVGISPSGKVAWRRTIEKDSQLRWVAIVRDLVFASDGRSVSGIDPRRGLEVFRHGAKDAPPPAFDGERIYQPDEIGLGAFAR